MSDDPKTIKSIIDLLYLPNEGKLLPESDRTGNIEYKLRLDKKGNEKRDNMVSQMLFRLNEGRNQYGRYEANYILGVHDNGTFSDLSEQTLANSTNILRGIAKKANSKIVSEKTYVFPGNKLMTHVVIRKDHKERNVPESNVMILGPSGVGKSSLMGRLTYRQKDDGNGFSRKLVLRHMHEKTSGNTSCPKYDTVGFAGDNIINYSIGIEFNMENIYAASDRLVNLIDIPGDIVAFSKTILYSVSSIKPDHIIVCVPCRCIKTIDPDTDEHNKKIDEINKEDSEEFVKKNADIYKFILAVCIMYKIQPIFVLTKYDLMHCTDTDSYDYPSTASKIALLFNAWRDELMTRSHSYEVTNNPSETKELPNEIQQEINHDSLFGHQDDEQSDTRSDDQSDDLNSDTKSDYVSSISDTKIVDFQKSQYIEVSNITDHGYQKLINTLSKISMVNHTSQKQEKLIKEKMFVVNDVFTIPDTGTIFHGILRYGVINVDDNVNIVCHGVVTKHKVKSIHRKTLDVDRLLPGESGSVTFHGKIDKIDKTAVIIDASWEKELVSKTNVVSVFDSVKLKSQQYMLFVGNNIITVILTPSSESDNIFEVNSFNDIKFMIDSEVGILKDERHNYFFVRFI